MIDHNISLTCGDPQSPDRPGAFRGSISGRLKPEPDEGIVNLLTVVSHDIRGSLLSMLATLKLLNRGYYGKMDDEAARKINGLLSTVTRLTTAKVKVKTIHSAGRAQDGHKD